MAVRWITDQGQVIEYAVTLLVEDENGELQPIRTYDNAHGDHEMHHYENGEKQAAERLESRGPNIDLPATIEAIKSEYETMIEDRKGE